MLWITLDEVKQTVRRTDTAADTELTRLGNAAEAWVAKYLNKPSAAGLEDFALSGQSPPVLDEDLKAAMLLYVEYLYDKDPESAPTLLRAIFDLLQPNRVDGIGV